MRRGLGNGGTVVASGGCASGMVLEQMDFVFHEKNLLSQVPTFCMAHLSDAHRSSPLSEAETSTTRCRACVLPSCYTSTAHVLSNMNMVKCGNICTYKCVMVYKTAVWVQLNHFECSILVPGYCGTRVPGNEYSFTVRKLKASIFLTGKQ